MTRLLRLAPLLLAWLSAPPLLAQWSTLAAPANFETATTVAGRPAFSSGADVHLYDPGTQSSFVTTLPQITSATAACSAGGLAVFTDGRLVDLYRPTPTGGSWTSTTMSSSHAAVAVTSVGEQVIFAGGDGAGSGSTGPLVEILDVGTMTWTAASPAPFRVGLAATSAHGLAFLAGGDTGGPGGFGFHTDRIDIYEASAGSWSTAALSVPRTGCTGASVGTKVLFAGGIGHAGRVATVDLHDTATGAWSTASLSTARANPTALTVGTKVFFVGGDGTDVVDVYDDATGSWSATTLSAAFGCPSPFTPLRDPATAGGPLGLFYSRCSNELFAYDDSLGVRYCTPGAASSAGEPAVLDVQGFPGTAVQGHALLTARFLPPQSFGYFLNSTAQGFTANPGGSQGNLCLSGAVGRYAASPFDSGAAGQAELRLDLSQTPTPTGAVSIVAGETWNFQAWFRDANPGPTSNFTDAVGVTFQ